MKTLDRGIAALAGLCLALAGNAGAATDQHAAGHAHEPAAKLELDHGRRWATDAPLRRGMDALRAAFAGRLAAIHAGTLAPADFAALGATIEAEVATIVAECQLEPKADAVLHVIVAELLAAADVLQGRAPGPPAAGAHRAVIALNDYGRYFDHPQWRALQ
jgi:hypothetical protein